MFRTQLHGAIFDWGNTLCDYPLGTEAEQTDYLRNFLEDPAVYSDVRSVSAPVGVSMTALKSFNEERSDYKVVPFSDRLKRIFPRISGEDAHALELKLCNRIFSSSHLLPGAIEAVAHVKALGLKAAVLSNTPWGTDSRLWKSEVLRYESVSKCCDVIMFCGDCGYRKPRSEPFEHCLTRLDVSSNRAVMIGDNIASDIIGARKVGCETIWLCRDAMTCTAEVGHVVNSLHEVLSIFEKL